MKRIAYTMKVHPEHMDEYRRRHEQVWPELLSELKRAGVSDYSIFLDESTGTLFAVQKRTDDNTVAALPDHPAVRKWWEFMADIMETNPDNSPVERYMTEVFHLE